jgi:hypothetical protein
MMTYNVVFYVDDFSVYNFIYRDRSVINIERLKNKIIDILNTIHYVRLNSCEMVDNINSLEDNPDVYDYTEPSFNDDWYFILELVERIDEIQYYIIDKTICVYF